MTSEDKTYEDMGRGSRPNTCMAADFPFNACDPRSASPEGGRTQRVYGLAGEKDRVAGGLGELLDAGRDVDGVADQSELELACAANGSGDHWTGVDPDADPKFAVGSLGDEAVDESSGAYRRIGVIRKIIRCAEDGQRAIAEELVDMPTSVHDGRHHDLE